MPPLVATLLLFTAVGAGFVFVNLVVGRFLRPNKPDAEKSAAYECGEEATGTTQVQFDLRYYVVALLFVLFEVGVAFFFPWAEVFGTAADAADVASRGADPEKAAAASRFAWLILGEMAVFFGVLLVGFAYLWGRGDLTWVKATATPGRLEEKDGSAGRTE